jgi:TRAP-type C4-dicarboxylate transport system permease small subunit
MAKFLRFLNEIPAHAAGIILFLALTDLLIQIAARAFMSGGAPAWTEEVARMSLIWISFLGAAGASIRGEHLVVDMLPSPPRVVRILWDVVIELIIPAIAGVMLYGAWKLFGITSGNVLPATNLSAGLVYAPVILATAVILLKSGITILLLLRSLVDPVEAEFAPIEDETTSVDAKV